jgi:hypothetical protein
VIGHANRRDNAVDRKDHVDQNDLNEAAPRLKGDAGISAALASSGSTRWWISVVALQTRKRPPASNMTSRAEKARPKTAATGAVRRAAEAAEARSTSRNASASDNPSPRAKARRRSSMRLDKSAMNALATLIAMEVVLGLDNLAFGRSGAWIVSLGLSPILVHGRR